MHACLRRSLLLEGGPGITATLRNNCIKLIPAVDTLSFTGSMFNTYIKTAPRGEKIKKKNMNGMRSSKADGNVPGGKDYVWRLKWKKILNYGGSDNVLITQAVGGCRGKIV